MNNMPSPDRRSANEASAGERTFLEEFFSLPADQRARRVTAPFNVQLVDGTPEERLVVAATPARTGLLSRFIDVLEPILVPKNGSFFLGSLEMCVKGELSVITLPLSDPFGSREGERGGPGHFKVVRLGLDKTARDSFTGTQFGTDGFGRIEVSVRCDLKAWRAVADVIEKTFPDEVQLDRIFEVDRFAELDFAEFDQSNPSARQESDRLKLCPYGVTTRYGLTFSYSAAALAAARTRSDTSPEPESARDVVAEIFANELGKRLPAFTRPEAVSWQRDPTR